MRLGGVLRAGARAAILVALAVGWRLTVAPASASEAANSNQLSGAFIQLNRDLAQRSVADWRGTFDRMEAVGLRLAIVQWTAEAPIAYFRGTNSDLTEGYESIERMFEAARGRSFQFYLGLRHDPDYWNQLTAKEQVLRDYLAICVERHARLQRGLLQSFGREASWVGYYIPEEIDDLTWRQPGRAPLLNRYLVTLVRALRTADPGRPIAISTFFRGRTEPGVYARTLADVTKDAGLDYLLLQDGAGAGDLPLPLLSPYLERVKAALGPSGPKPWLVVEAFRQVQNRPDSPFHAHPAPPDEFRRQLQLGAGFPRVVAFSFPDYLDPERNPAARGIYESLRPGAGRR